MSVFKDKVYDNMDWLSQAIEPILNPLNDTLKNLPEEFPISREALFKCVVNSWNRALNKDSACGVMYREALDSKTQSGLTWEDRDVLNKCYDLEMSPEPIIIEAETMTGWVKLVKKVQTLEDDVARRSMMRQHLRVAYRDCKKEAIIELGQIMLNTEELKDNFNKAKSREKFGLLYSYVSDAAKNDSFRIRSVVAYKNFIDLISDFLASGNPVYLGKIYRVIAMAKNEQPVYVVEANNESNR